jgi:hypothetical protein
MGMIALCSAVAIGSLLATAAFAAPRLETFYKAGPWEAWGGYSSPGRTVCGVSTSGLKGRFFSFKHFNDDDYVTVQANEDSWNFPDGTTGRVALEFDNLGPWDADAYASGGTIQFIVRLDQIDRFEQEFRHAYRMAIYFGGGEGWIADLTGTNRIASAFATCIQAQADA